jgi:hypothetical protein
MLEYIIIIILWNRICRMHRRSIFYIIIINRLYLLAFALLEFPHTLLSVALEVHTNS